jgi:hypothetical protein
VTESVTGTFTKTVEVLHFGGYDVVLNTSHPDKERVRELLKTVKNGIPPTWRPYVVGEDDEEKMEQGRGSEINTLVDNEVNPRFFAKRRANINFYGIGKRASSNTIGEEEIVSRLHRRKGNVYNSIVSEFALTPKIISILGSKRVVDIVSNYGFSSIRYVAPILGLIQRSTGEKTVIYDYVDADDWFTSHDTKIRENKIVKLGDKGEGLCDELVVLFKNHGIFPGDFGDHQLMSSRDPDGSYFLYLIDSEGYFQDTRGEFKNLPAGGI